MSLGILEALKLSWSGNAKTYHRDRFIIDRLETILFEPSKHYVRQCMMQPEVLDHMNNNRSIFMITDIRIAYGAFITHEEFRAKGAKVAVNVPLSTVQLGPDVGVDFGRKKFSHTSSESLVPHEFVFAYRLNEILYNRTTQTFDTNRYIKKADLHGLRGAEAVEEEPVVVMDKSDSLGPEDFDYELAEDFTELEGNNSQFKDGCILVGAVGAVVAPEGI